MNVQRIAALLAKAERTDNAAEAEAYLMKAQALATAASIDLAFARAAQPSSRAEPETRTLTIGERGKRANRHLVALFIALAHNNDAHVDVAHDSTFVIVYGMPSDIDVVEQLFNSISVQMVISSRTWVSLGEWRGQTYVSSRTRRRKPHTAQTARTAFMTAYIARIDERLAKARQETQQADHRVRSSHGALILREKAAEIDAFHRANSAARGRWSGYSGAVRDPRGAAAQAGRQAASRVALQHRQGVGQRRALMTGSERAADH
jgi:hypothetical protein